MAQIFTFRLDGVLEYRRLKQEMARRDETRARHALTEHNRGVLEILREQEDARRELVAMKGHELDIARLRLQEGYLEVLDRRLRRALDRLQELAVEERDTRARLRDEARKVRALERLRDRRKTAHVRVQDRRERIFLDEVGSRKLREAS